MFILTSRFNLYSVYSTAFTCLPIISSVDQSGHVDLNIPVGSYAGLAPHCSYCLWLLQEDEGAWSEIDHDPVTMAIHASLSTAQQPT